MPIVPASLEMAIQKTDFPEQVQGKPDGGIGDLFSPVVRNIGDWDVQLFGSLYVNIVVPHSTADDQSTFRKKR